METWAFFSTLPGQVLLWGMASLAFWALSRLPDRESLEFVVLDALVLISALVALLTVPFVFLAQSIGHGSILDAPVLPWVLAAGALSLLLSADALVQMKRFFGG